MASVTPSVIKIKLGQRVRHRITGFTGVAIGRTEWLYGHTEIHVQPVTLTEEGDLREEMCFPEAALDEEELEDQP